MAAAALTGYSRKVEQINDSLHVYAGGDDVIMDYAVSEFQRRYPDIEVVYEGRRIIEDTEAFYGYNQQLSAELMSGSGADVFFIQDYWDVDKLIQAGAFADLSAIYDSCAVFQDADLQNDIMDAGVFDGKRYFLPMEYRLPMMVTTREALDATGFDIEKCTNFDSFMTESSRYMNSADYDRRLFRMDVSAMNCIFWSGYPIADSSEVIWDIEEARGYFAWYREVYEHGTGEYIRRPVRRCRALFLVVYMFVNAFGTPAAAGEPCNGELNVKKQKGKAQPRRKRLSQEIFVKLQE